MKDLELFKLENIRFMGNLRTIFKYMKAGGNPERPGEEPNIPEPEGLAFVFCSWPKENHCSHLSLCLFLSFGVLGTSVMTGPWLQILKGHFFPQSPDQDEKHFYCFPEPMGVFPDSPFHWSIVLSSNFGHDVYDNLSSSIILYNLKSFSSTNIFFLLPQQPRGIDRDFCFHSNMPKDTQVDKTWIQVQIMWHQFFHVNCTHSQVSDTLLLSSVS